MEANPENVDVAALDAWLAAGITRLSVGMQSADPDALRVLQRQHTPGAAVGATRLARDRGFEHVSLDQGENKFDLLPRSLPRLKASLARWQDGLAERGWNSLYLNNHDQPRLVSRFGNDSEYRYESATLWALVLHLHRGTPYIYQGEEIGMTNVRFDSIDDYRDIESLNHFCEAVQEFDQSPSAVLAGVHAMGRDNARTPMQLSLIHI